MDQATSFGQWLQRRRKALGLTQAELGAHVGCAGATIRKIEADQRRPSQQIAERLAQCLHIDATDRADFVKFARGLRHRSLPAPVHPAFSNGVALAGAQRSATMPSFATPLIGRQRELNDLVTLIQRDEVRLLTVVGTGGIGKSRLALALAQTVAEAFEHGVVYVPLTTVSTADALVDAAATALNITLQGNANRQAQLAEHLQSRQILLILDNYEQLLPAIDLVTNVIHATPQVKLLITSRQRFGSQWEWVFDLDGLCYPATTDVADWETYAAIQLFLHCAQRANYRFSLADHAASVVRICEIVQGLPLAIELAAGTLREQSCDDIARQLEHNLDCLHTDLRDVAERHRSMTAVFDHAWNLLSDDEQRVLAQLAIFQGGWTLEAAEHVADGSFALLGTLVDTSLVRLDDTGRYTIHELLRRYIAGRLAAQPNLHHAACQRHVTYFLQLADQAAPMLHQAGGADWIARLKQEQANVRAALDWAQTHMPIDLALRLATALAEFWLRCGYWNEGCDRLEAVLQRASSVPADGLYAGAQLQLARLRGKSAQYVQGYICALAAYGHYESLGDPRGQAQSASLLGSMALHRGDYTTARTHYDTCLALHQTLNDPDGAARVRFNLWILATKSSDFATGRTHLTESVRLFRRLGDPEALANALTNLGALRAEIEANYDEARALSEESVALYRSVGDVWGLSYALNNLGEVYVAQGHSALARACFKESYAIASEHGNTYGLGTAQLELGNLAWHEGDFEQARELYAHALAQLRTLGNRWYIATAMQCLARVYQSVGATQQAAACYQDSLALHWNLHLKHCVPISLAGLALLAAQAGDLYSAARMQGANDALVASIEFGMHVFHADRLLYEQNIATTRRLVKIDAYIAEYNAGQHMPLAAVIDAALARKSV